MNAPVQFVSHPLPVGRKLPEMVQSISEQTLLRVPIGTFPGGPSLASRSMPMIRPTFLLDIVPNNLLVSLEIVSVLGLQILLSIPESRPIYQLCGTPSCARWLVLVVCISVLLSWTTVFNMQLFLAPSFTFTTETVVMTNPCIAVVLTYAGCIVISLGSLFGTAAFLPKTPDPTGGGIPIPVLAAGIQGEFSWPLV